MDVVWMWCKLIALRFLLAANLSGIYDVQAMRPAASDERPGTCVLNPSRVDTW